MPSLPTPIATAALLAVMAGAGPAAADPAGLQRAQFVIQQQIVVRVQRPQSRSPALPIRPVVWTEKKGPKCVQLGTLAGALFTEPEAVDLVFVGGDRVRARFDDNCPALDFYPGFYLKPTRDGKVCAGRDPVRSRSGQKCGIAKFRKLIATR